MVSDDRVSKGGWVDSCVGRKGEGGRKEGREEMTVADQCVCVLG